MSRLNKRVEQNICDTNCVVLTMGEAVKRWTRDGQFMMTEVNSTDSYEGKDINIDTDSISARIGKIEAALAGMDFVKEVKASASQQPSSVQQSSQQSSSESAPAE